MAINLNQLEQAASRYDDHQAALKNADPEATLREKEAVAKRHQDLFTPASEKLLNLRTAAAAAAAVAGVAVAPEPDLAPAGRRLLVLDGDLMKMEAGKLLQTQVLKTFVNGEMVYEKK